MGDNGGIGLQPDHAARLVRAFEEIAQSLTRLADSTEMRYQQDYPARKEPRDATITRIKSPEDLARESQQGSSNGSDTSAQSLASWLDPLDALDNPADAELLGPREREFIERERLEREEANARRRSSPVAVGDNDEP